MLDDLILKTRCYNGGNKHKFEPRCSEKSPFNQNQKFELTGCTAKEMRSMMFYKVYECDVCVWCGKVINKSN